MYRRRAAPEVRISANEVSTMSGKVDEYLKKIQDPKTTSVVARDAYFKLREIFKSLRNGLDGMSADVKEELKEELIGILERYSEMTNRVFTAFFKLPVDDVRHRMKGEMLELSKIIDALLQALTTNTSANNWRSSEAEFRDRVLDKPIKLDGAQILRITVGVQQLLQREIVRKTTGMIGAVVRCKDPSLGGRIHTKFYDPERDDRLQLPANMKKYIEERQGQIKDALQHYLALTIRDVGPRDECVIMLGGESGALESQRTAGKEAMPTDTLVMRFPEQVRLEVPGGHPKVLETMEAWMSPRGTGLQSVSGLIQLIMQEPRTAARQVGRVTDGGRHRRS